MWNRSSDTMGQYIMVADQEMRVRQARNAKQTGNEVERFKYVGDHGINEEYAYNISYLEIGYLK